MPRVLAKRKKPMPMPVKNAKGDPTSGQFTGGPKNPKAAMPKGLKTLPSIGQPKSPAATVSGQRMDKMPSFPVWGAKSVGQTVHKLPSLSDPKS